VRSPTPLLAIEPRYRGREAETWHSPGTLGRVTDAPPTTKPAPRTPSEPPVKPRLVKHPWRVAIVIGSLLVLANLGILLLASTDTSQSSLQPLPNEIESISPERGALTPLIDTITVDLRDDMSGVLVVDGVEIPEDQLERVVGLQQVIFRPGAGKEIPRFRGGDNSVVVKYWRGRLQDRPANPYTFGWTFRATA